MNGIVSVYFQQVFGEPGSASFKPPIDIEFSDSNKCGWQSDNWTLPIPAVGDSLTWTDQGDQDFVGEVVRRQFEYFDGNCGVTINIKARRISKTTLLL